LRRLLTTGVCAGAALWGGAALSVQAQQPVAPVGYNMGLWGGHGGQPGCCAPPCRPYAYPYAPSYAPSYPHAGTPTEAPRQDGDATTPSPTPDAAPGDVSAPQATPGPAPSFSSLSGATGTPTAPLSASPNAVGDFFGISHPFFVQTLGFGDFYVPDPSASVVGRIKASENNSPIPQDRLFLDYTFYDDVPFLGQGIGVSRFVPGFERVFLDGVMSVELRMPFAQTLSNSIPIGATPDGDSWSLATCTRRSKRCCTKTMPSRWREDWV
jgi:hypothetical protein